MTDQLAVAGFLFAIVGPWAMGAVWLHWWLARSGRYNIYVLLGQGYVLGMLGVGALLHLWQRYLGFELEFWPIAAVIAGLTLLGLVAHWLRPATAPLQLHWEAIPRWHLALIGLLMVFLVWRYVTLLQVLLLQPTLSPEALAGWSLRASVWFYEGALVPIVSVSEWLTQASPIGHPLPEAVAAAPEAVSLIQLWVMLSIGSADHSFVFLPWICLPIAIGFAVFGHLRLARVKTLHAGIATYAVLSLPALNLHTAMEGFADVWLVAVFTLAVCASYQWRKTRHWTYGLLALGLAFGCALVQHSGVIFGYVIVVGLVLGAFQTRGLAKSVLVLVALSLALAPSLWFIWAGFPAQQLLPGISLLDLPATWVSSAPHAQSTFSFHFFSQFILRDGQWHLVWYTAVLIALLGVLRGYGGRLLQSEWVVLLASGTWAVVHAYAVSAHVGYPADDLLTKGMLVVAPTIVFCLGLFGTGLARRE
ncbi:MAG: hypothetical protein AB8C02_06935 [Halioglobus sp.]